MTVLTRRQARLNARVGNLQTFTAHDLTGRLHAQRFDVEGEDFGRLNPRYSAMLASDLREDAIFIVRSYATPIAWCKVSTGEWTFPNVKYTPTTSGHQHEIIEAIEASMARHPQTYTFRRV